jgi:hypothetical protein
VLRDDFHCNQVNLSSQQKKRLSQKVICLDKHTLEDVAGIFKPEIISWLARRPMPSMVSFCGKNLIHDWDPLHTKQFDAIMKSFRTGRNVAQENGEHG